MAGILYLRLISNFCSGVRFSIGRALIGSNAQLERKQERQRISKLLITTFFIGGLTIQKYTQQTPECLPFFLSINSCKTFCGLRAISKKYAKKRKCLINITP